MSRAITVLTAALSIVAIVGSANAQVPVTDRSQRSVTYIIPAEARENTTLVVRGMARDVFPGIRDLTFVEPLTLGELARLVRAVEKANTGCRANTEGRNGPAFTIVVNCVPR